MSLLMSVWAKDSRSLVKTASAAAAVLLMTSCSHHSGTGPGPGPDGAYGPQPIPPGPSMDLDAAALTQNGCLNLQGVIQKFREFPAGTMMRSYSANFNMKKSEGSKSKMRANFIAEMAFRHFAFTEKPAAISMSDWPQVTQNGCQDVQFSREIDGTQAFTVAPAPSANAITLVSENGNQTTYTLINARQLEVRSVEHGFDTCPEHVKVGMATRKIMEWGSEPDLQNAGVEISREFLKRIKAAVSELPEALRTILVYDQSPMVKVASNDLRSLAQVQISSEVVRCPYRPKPPNGDEPPPEADRGSTPSSEPEVPPPASGEAPVPPAEPNPPPEPEAPPVP